MFLTVFISLFRFDLFLLEMSVVSIPKASFFSCSQSSLVCPVPQQMYGGQLLSISPSNGEELWVRNSSTKLYLPSLDVVGNVISTSTESIEKILVNGSEFISIDVSDISPIFGAVVTDEHTILVLSSKTEAPQILALETNGKILDRVNFVDVWKGVNGTFVPCGHPVFNGSRMYVITRFVAHNKQNNPFVFDSSGAERLYALDISRYYTYKQSMIVWYRDIKQYRKNIHISKSTEKIIKRKESFVPTILMLHNKTVYINFDEWGAVRTSNHQGLSGHSTILGIHDHGNTSEVAFRTPLTSYGGLVTYAHTRRWGHGTDVTAPSTAFWVLNVAPAYVTGSLVTK